jgi:hypothetical protein
MHLHVVQFNLHAEQLNFQRKQLLGCAYSEKALINLQLKVEFTSSRVEPKCCIKDESTVATLRLDRYTWYLSNPSSEPI